VIPSALACLSFWCVKRETTSPLPTSPPEHTLHMARTRASRSSGTQKKTSSSGSQRGSAPKIMVHPDSSSSSSPGRRSYGLQNHTRRCPTPEWQRSVSEVMPGLTLNPQRRAEEPHSSTEKNGSIETTERGGQVPKKRKRGERRKATEEKVKKRARSTEKDA